MVGTNSKGKPLYTMKVVSDELGDVITAFPKKQEDIVMNFYIGNSIDGINPYEDDNIEFSDELLHFIHKLSKQSSFDMSKLCKIDPYGDVKISKIDLPEIIEICNYILDKSLLQNYEERDIGYQELKNLIEIARKGMIRDLGLISIGD